MTLHSTCHHIFQTEVSLFQRINRVVWDSASKLKSLLHSSQRVVKGLCGTWWGQNLVCDAWKQLKETGDAWIYEKKHW